MKKFWLGLMAAALAVGCDSRKATADDAAAAAPEGAVAAAAEAGAPEVLATVNGVDITAEKVDRVVKMFTDRIGESVGPAELAAILPRVKERALEELIEQQILISAADAAGIELSDAEFEEVMGELKEELPEGMTLESFLETTGLGMDEIRGQMRIRKMMLEKANEAGEPGEEEVREFYEAHKDAMAEKASVTASHILVKVDGEEGKEAALAKINDLKKQLDEGADFAELARENSDCPSRADGGNLGKFGRGMMVPEFEEAAFTQEIGKVGDVVETSFGYHLVLVKERTEDRTVEFDEVKERLTEMMKAQKQQEVIQQFLEGLEEAAVITRYDAVVEGNDDEEPLDLVVEEDEVFVEEEEAPAAAAAAAEEVPAVEEAPVAEAAAAAEEAVEEAVEEAKEAVAEASEAAEEAAETTEEAAVEVEAAIEGATEAVAEDAAE